MDEPLTSVSHRKGKPDDMLFKVSELERSRGKEKHMNFFVSTKSLHFSRRVRSHNLVLTNVEPFPLTYTIRTTHPKLFRAYPSKGVIPKESQSKLFVKVNSINPNDFKNMKVQIVCTVRDSRGFEMKKLIKCRLDLSEDMGKPALLPKKEQEAQGEEQGEQQEIIASLLDAVRAKGEHVLRALPSRKNMYTYALAIFPLVFGLLLSVWIAASRSTPASFLQKLSKGADVLLSYAIGTLSAWVSMCLWAK
jgi:hypothetical protein